MDSTTIGKRIQEVRKARGLSQAELAQLCDLTPKYISHLETGTRAPRLETLIVLANALNCDANTLLGDLITNAESSRSDLELKIARLSPSEKELLSKLLDVVLAK